MGYEFKLCAKFACSAFKKRDVPSQFPSLPSFFMVFRHDGGPSWTRQIRVAAKYGGATKQKESEPYRQRSPRSAWITTWQRKKKKTSILCFKPRLLWVSCHMRSNLNCKKSMWCCYRDERWRSQAGAEGMEQRAVRDLRGGAGFTHRCRRQEGRRCHLYPLWAFAWRLGG